MTLPRYSALSAHWKKFPPVHVSLSAIARGLSRTPTTAELPSEEKAENDALYHQMNEAPEFEE